MRKLTREDWAAVCALAIEVFVLFPMTLWVIFTY